jgi:cation:H+ antiporter
LQLSLWEGLLLLGVFAGLIVLTVHGARSEAAQNRIRTANFEADPTSTASHPAKNSLMITIGLVGLATGAKMAIDGAVVIGTRAGLSEAVIALTIIAFGTSLPELVTCVVAALKGHHDISVGNLVGSNIFNTLLVTGTAGVVRPFEIAPRLAGGADYWIMIGVSLGFAGAVIIGRRTIGRLAGTVLVGAYVAYVAYLLLV